MRTLIAVIVIAATAWGGYWFIGARAVDRGLTAWFAARQADGWTAEYDDLSVRGFPSRFDATITELDLADPQTGLAWSAPFVQILALSYRPHHVILALPDTQIVATPLGQIEVAGTGLRGSVVFRPTPDLPLDRATFVGRALTLTRGPDVLAMDELRLAVDDATGPSAPTAKRLGVDMLGVTLPLFPDPIEELRLDATVDFDRDWDARSVGGPRPAPTRIAIETAQLDWGDARLTADGTLEVDASGIPTGRLTLRATGWRDLLDRADAAGLVPTGDRDRIAQALQFVQALSGGGGTIEVPLIFAEGRVSAGPIPLGAAPRLR